MATAPAHRVSVAEYLALERSSETKSEYLDGEVVAMAGASRRHNLVVGNAFASLHRQLNGRSCEVYAADMRVWVPSVSLFTYPDVVVVCGEPRFDDGEEDTLLNPTLLVEILSPSTESYDRGNKFAYYRSLPSLAEVLLLAQDRICAEHFIRQAGDSWLLTERSHHEDVIELPSIGCSLALAEVYERVV